MMDATGHVFQRCGGPGCDHWLAEDETFCPNCGRHRQDDLLPRLVNRITVKGGKVAKGCFGAFYAGNLALIAAIGLFIGGGVGGMVALGMGIVSTGMFGGAWLGARKLKRLLAPPGTPDGAAGASLQKEEAALRGMIDDLRRKRADLSRTRARIAAAASGAALGGGAGAGGWGGVAGAGGAGGRAGSDPMDLDHFRPVIEKLEMGIAIIEAQHRRTEARLRRIEAVRWLNTLKPLTANWFRIDTRKACESALVDLKNATGRGRKILEKWRTRPDLSAMTESRQTMTQVEEALAACRTLTADLTARLGNLALAEASVANPCAGDRSDLDDAAVAQLSKIMAIAEMRKDAIAETEEEMRRELNRMEAELEVDRFMASIK